MANESGNRAADKEAVEPLWRSHGKSGRGHSTTKSIDTTSVCPDRRPNGIDALPSRCRPPQQTPAAQPALPILDSTAPQQPANSRLRPHPFASQNTT